MVEGLIGWMMSRRNNVKVYSFSGATTYDMKDFLNPLLSRKPSSLILHVGTTDLAYDDPQYSEPYNAGHTTWYQMCSVKYYKTRAKNVTNY